MADPSACARCARRGVTCCQTTADADDFCFPVSAEEQRRLLPYVSGQEVIRSAGNSTLFLQRIRSLFPNERRRVAAVFPSSGTHDRLALDSEGRCILLAPEGCRLPREARPLYCRLYPFWVVDERLCLLSHDGCLAQEEFRSQGELLRHFETSAGEVMSVYRLLRLYWHIDNE